MNPNQTIIKCVQPSSCVSPPSCALSLLFFFWILQTCYTNVNHASFSYVIGNTNLPCNDYTSLSEITTTTERLQPKTGSFFWSLRSPLKNIELNREGKAQNSI